MVHPLMPRDRIPLVLASLVVVGVQIRSPEEVVQAVQLVRSRKRGEIPATSRCWNLHSCFGMLRLGEAIGVLVNREGPHSPVLLPRLVYRDSWGPFERRGDVVRPLDAG